MRTVWILASSLVLMAQASDAAGPVADLVVVGQIHTMAKPGEVAEGMAVADGKIIFVGSATARRHCWRRMERSSNCRRMLLGCRAWWISMCTCSTPG